LEVVIKMEDYGPSVFRTDRHDLVTAIQVAATAAPNWRLRFVELLVRNNAVHTLKCGRYMIVHTPRLSDYATVLDRAKALW